MKYIINILKQCSVHTNYRGRKNNKNSLLMIKYGI